MLSSDELKYYIKYNNGAQNRCVTIKDYHDRIAKLPARYGCPFRYGVIEENNKIMLYYYLYALWRSHYSQGGNHTMITVSDLGINFSGQDLFKHVDLKFVPGNCYGVIGANGAGKSTFLRILSGDLEPTSGEVIIDKRTRMSVLKQDHFAYDEQTVLDTIIQGNPRLYEIMQQKDALYLNLVVVVLKVLPLQF